MKKALALFTMLVWILCVPHNMLAAEETPAMPALEKALADYPGYCVVGGTETGGVTFVVNDVHADADVLTISVMLLPNDDFTSVVDNQVDDADDSSALNDQIALASRYGDKVLGTLCDIADITDAEGNSLLTEYKVLGDRNGPAMVTVFSVYLSPESMRDEVLVELVCGVNEDLNARFPQSDSIHLRVPLPGDR